MKTVSGWSAGLLCHLPGLVPWPRKCAWTTYMWNSPDVPALMYLSKPQPARMEIPALLLCSMTNNTVDRACCAHCQTSHGPHQIELQRSTSSHSLVYLSYWLFSHSCFPHSPTSLSCFLETPPKETAHWYQILVSVSASGRLQTESSTLGRILETKLSSQIKRLL